MTFDDPFNRSMEFSDRHPVLFFGGLITGLVVFIFAFAVSCSLLVGTIQCKALQYEIGIPSYYSWWVSDCILTVDGKLIPKKNWRVL